MNSSPRLDTVKIPCSRAYATVSHRKVPKVFRVLVMWWKDFTSSVPQRLISGISDISCKQSRR